MTDIENEYGDTQRSPEAHEYRKTTSAMLKGFAGLKFQKSEQDFPTEIITNSPEVLDMAKQAIALTQDDETADWVLMAQLRKAGVPIPKLNDISRTSIGSITGGRVPKKKLPSEVEEGLTNMDNAMNRLSPGQPEAQIRARGTYSGPSNSRGWTDQNQTGGSELNPTIAQINQSTAQLGRTSSPRATNLRDNQNPSFSVGRGEMGEVGSPGQSGQYSSERASLPYDSISQKPGDARTTYKTYDARFSKSAPITVDKNSGSIESPATSGLPQTERMLTKSRRIQVGENAFVESKSTPESETTYAIKHMVAGLMKEMHPMESMQAEDEALSAEAMGGTAQHMEEEARLDDEDEAKFEEAEALADEMEKQARRFELNGDWKRRDDAYEMAKSYRAQAQSAMKRIATRKGTLNFSTGM